LASNYQSFWQMLIETIITFLPSLCILLSKLLCIETAIKCLIMSCWWKNENDASASHFWSLNHYFYLPIDEYTVVYESLAGLPTFARWEF
jgi:hypothetical protein